MIQEYFYLIFASNPSKEKVSVYPDGESSYLYMSHKNFLVLFQDVPEIVPNVKEALATYGTFWLYDRVNNQISRLDLLKEDITSPLPTLAELNGLLSEDSSNPSEQYAYSNLSSYIIEEDKIGQMKVKTQIPSVHLKK